ncbi:MAG: carbohydrate kinase family protein [Planctomycetota bacterium]|nr:carbohydrate kinase family protein [Planctomycetota bacterium]
MPETLDVLAAADLCVDLVLRGDVRPRFGQAEQLVEGYALELGGSACLFASQFAKLGGRAGVAGFLGADLFGRFARERLAECGVEVSRVRARTGLQTGLGLALAAPDDRAILTCLGSIDAAEPEDLDPAWLGACRHWHIASYFLLRKLRPHWPAWLRRAREAGVTVSLDPNFDPDERWAGVRELLPLVDVFLPNATEARAIAGVGDLREAGRRLAARGPLTVIKCGAEGVLAFDGTRAFERVAEPAPRIADAIGAGDCFDAGFLRAWQAGLELGACLAWGQRCAAASLAEPGGVRGQLACMADAFRVGSGRMKEASV